MSALPPEVEWPGDAVVLADLEQIWSWAQPEATALAGSTLLLTGSTGFVGRSILEAVLWLNRSNVGPPCRVLLPSRRPQLLSRRYAAEVSAGEIRVFPWRTDFQLSLASGSVDFAIHAAAPADPRTFAQAPRSSAEDMLRMALSLSELAGAGTIGRTLLLSSGAVYGKQPGSLQEISEDYVGGPDLRDDRSGYGEAKRMEEVLLRMTGSDIRVARIFSLLGPYQDLQSSFAVPDLFRQADLLGELTLRGDGRSVRSYCYVTDLITFLFKFLLGTTRCGVYNVGSKDATVTIEALANEIATIFGGIALTKDSSASPASNQRYVPAVDRMLEVWRPRISLRHGLVRVAHSLFARNLISRRPVIELADG